MTDPRISNGSDTTDTVHARGVALSGLGILMGIGICLLVSAFFFHWLGSEQMKPPGGPAEVVLQTLPANGPRLQEDPQKDYEKFARNQQEKLNSYGWIDREGNRVHIPIEVAMEDLVKTGLSAPGRGMTRTQLQQNRATQPTDVEGAK